MTSVRRLEHASLFVEDVERAVTFYTDVLGLVEFAREDGVVYLGCGLDGNFDLAVSAGGTGVEHFAVRAGGRLVDDYEERLVDHGTETTRTDGDEPGQSRGVRFDLPSGDLSMEIVEVEDPRYHNPADVGNLPTSSSVHPERSPVAPRDVDHIGIFSSDIEADVEFLRDVLGFRLSDVGLSPEGDPQMVFTRAGQHHHDVVVFDEPEHTLGHLAWDMDDVSHMRQLADHLAASGHGLETPMVRHGPGSNVATYFKEPGGNRFEVTTGVESVDPAAEVGHHTVRDMPFCVWSDVRPPESFFEGS